VREWYIRHDKNIVNKIDKSLAIKEQAIKAHLLRNKYRMQARKLMKDRELAEYLDANHSNLPFEYYEEKYSKRGYTGNLLYRKILEASNRTNKKVNRELGIA
jgi:hypothetical protein